MPPPQVAWRKDLVVHVMLRTARNRRHPVRCSPVPALLVGLTLLLSACGAGDAAGDAAAQTGDDLAIVATTTILGDVTRNVAGDLAEVSVLMPPGADPHGFEPSAQQLAQMQDADLVVANGADLEAQLTDALAEVERAGVPVFRATEHIDTLTFEGHDAHADAHGHDDAHADESDAAVGDGQVDPHFWWDPTRMADVVRALGQRLATLADGAGASEAAGARAADYAQRLAAVDRDVEQLLAAVPADERRLVTNHEAFGYFADRYGFEIVGTVIPSVSTGAEPSARDLEELAHTIEQQQVDAIFTETIASDALADALATEVGADLEVVELHSDALGDEGSGPSTYVDLLRTNARRIHQALAG